MIYLNNSSTTWPKPDSVYEAVAENIKLSPRNYARTGITSDSDNLIYQCRKNLASLFGISDPEQIIFTSGSTEALNTAIHGLDLTGGHVIITAGEHNSVIRPLKTLEKDGSIEISIAKCGKDGIVNPHDIKDLVKQNTRLIVVNHGSNVTGAVQDAAAIAAIAHEAGALILLDASQSAGNIQIYAEKWGVDLLAFTAHKSLYGIQGSGGLYIKKGTPLKPLKQGGTGVKSNILLQPDEMPLKYEAGTMNTPGIAALKAGTDFVIDTTFENIESKKQSLRKLTLEGLNLIPNIRIFHSKQEHALPVISFLIGDVPPEEINYILAQSFDISIRSGLHCAPLIHNYLDTPYGTLRVSPSIFTKEQEINKFLSAITKISEDFV